MSSIISTPSSIIGRLQAEPRVADEPDGVLAAFVMDVEQVLPPSAEAVASSFRVICGSRWAELVRHYLKAGRPVFVAGDAITSSGQRGLAACAWLIADEVIPLGRYPAVESDEILLERAA